MARPLGDTTRLKNNIKIVRIAKVQKMKADELKTKEIKKI